MTETQNKGFDSKVRKLMLEAEAEVPSGVWESIVAASAPKETSSKVLPWSAVGFALAAVLLAFFFLKGTNTEQPLKVIDSSSYVSQTEALPESIEPVTSGQEASGTRKQISSNPRNLAQVVKTVEKPSDSKIQEEVKGRVAEQEETFPMDHKKPTRKKPTRKKPQLSIMGTMVGGEGSISSAAKGTSGIAFPSSTQTLTETSVSSFGVPFTVSVALRYELLPKFTIGTGLEYSLVSRTFSAEYSDVNGKRNGDVRHNMHYIGIPLMLSYNFLDNPTFSLYVTGGARVEWCLANKYDFRSANFSTSLSSSVKTPQTSAMLGAGAEYHVSDLFGIYLEPGVRYYFYSQQPKNLRTERPLLFDLSLGVRFNF